VAKNGTKSNEESRIRDETLRNMLKTPPKRHEPLGVHRVNKTKDKVSSKTEPDKPTEQED
jgi:hypothetical protein